MKQTKISKILLGLGLVGSLSIGTAYGSAFQLFDQSAEHLGNNYAGAGATANDASTEFYNPAGMTRLKQQEISAGGVVIESNVKFDGSIDNAPPGTAQAGVKAFVPNFHYVLPINNNWAFGFGITVPFGLQTEYTAQSIVGKAATLTSIKTVNFNPNIAYKIDSQWSVGFGLDAMNARGEFENVISSAGNVNDRSEASAWGYGYNLGVLYQLNNATRFGFSYRSKVVERADGKSYGDAFTTENMQEMNTKITLPGTAILSAYHDFDSHWAILGSAAYTQWNVFSNLTLNNVAELGGGAITVNLPQNFHNTWNFSLGGNYRINSSWLLQSGVGYDQSPTDDSDRNVRLPDSDRIPVAVGVQYQPISTLRFTAAYSHLFVRPTHVDNTFHQGAPVVEHGNFHSKADVFGMQVTWKF